MACWEFKSGLLLKDINKYEYMLLLWQPFGKLVFSSQAKIKLCLGESALTSTGSYSVMTTQLLLWLDKWR